MGMQDGGNRTHKTLTKYSQNDHFCLVDDLIYQFLGMEAKNLKFDMFYQQRHPSVALDDVDIEPRYASRIHTCHLFMA